MTTRRSEEVHSRESSWSTGSLIRANSHRESNPNIFSDDFALDSLDRSTDSSPTNSFRHSMNDLPAAPSHDQSANEAVMSSGVPNDIYTSSRPSSISKRPAQSQNTSLSIPHRTVSTLSHQNSTLNRSSSASSRLSVPRSQSPYVGATGPSHPYAMYPQVTRASSIASESTIRPVERAFIGGQGPEHPYSMYPQNTVEEEGDTIVPHPLLPLGFPGMSAQYQTGSRSTGNDVGDIVGSDGHVEELPPYTRYADNVVAKADSNSVVNAPTVASVEPPMSPVSHHTDSGVELNLGANRDAGNVPPAGLREKFSEKSKKRLCLGIPLWTPIVIVAVIVIAATVGGVIGRRVGSGEALAANSQPAPTATTTVWLDANPLPTNSPIPGCEIGQWMVPTSNSTLDSSACIVSNNGAQYAWGCSPPSGMPFTISKNGASGFNVTFNETGPSLTNGPFRYGPQLPQLGPLPYTMVPSTDVDDTQLGPAYFIWAAFDKLTILHQDDLAASYNKRSTFQLEQEVPYVGQPVGINDEPWFCWFNDTIFEFFIYVTQTASSSNGSSMLSSGYGASTTAGSSTYSTSLAGQQVGSMSTSSSWSWAIPTYSAPTPTYTSWPPVKPKEKRTEYTPNVNSSEWLVYPHMVKVSEKRKPYNSHPPQCFQMQIGKDWTVTPKSGVLPFNITESDTSTAQSKRWDMNIHEIIRRQNALRSPCACQWISD